jgi:uncharacterized membrane protein
MKRTKIIIFLIIILFFAVGFYLYPAMPENMASHWNAAGQVDGYLPKFWGLFLMPIISLIMALLFLWIPEIDPLKENIQKFRKYFDDFIILMMLFLFYIYFLSLFWNLGQRFNMIYMITPSFAVLFYYIGIMVEKAKRNWFIGIRTPWTLSSEVVWDKTHQIGGKLFKISALLVLVGIFFGRYAILFIIMPAILTAIYTFIYSYFEYQRITKK